MSFEKHFNFYSEEYGTTVRKGQTATFIANGKDLDLSKEHKLFVTGDTKLFFHFKTEPDSPQKYHSIEDALDPDNAYKSQYCLNLSEKAPEKLIKRIYKRIPWPPKLSFLTMKPLPSEFDFGIFAKAENLKIEPCGYFRIALDIRYKKEGVSPLFAGDEPDERIVIDLKDGSYDWSYIGQKVNINPEKCAMCGYWIEAYNYSGKIYIENPVLSGNGKNVVPEFSTPATDRAAFDWTSQNISKKEWPEFKVCINDKEIFDGKVFERCHVGGEWSIVIPQNVLTNGDNKIEITYTSDYHDVIPYSFHELYFIERDYADFEVVAITPSGAVGSTLPVLVKTRKDNVKVSFSCPSGKLSYDKTHTFEKAGLYGLQLCVNDTGNNTQFSFEYDGKTVNCTCPHLCIKQPDGVIVGTGDMIYIHQDKESFEEFICWYISNNVGNLVTMRPTYRWSGTRVFDGDLWRDFARVLNELGIKYSLMVDGRELPGMDCNAPDDVIGGKGFLGRQMHERDGAVYYWSPQLITSPFDRQFVDMGHRIFREKPELSHPERAAKSFIYKDDRICRYIENDVKEDYKIAHDYGVERTNILRDRATRHTGPTCMFNSFIEGGYNTIGAETLYISTEPACAFMRGVSDITKTPYTVHHALQWGSAPHDRLDHMQRYRLSLYVSYMQGVGEVNTEEGLWRMEESFSKFHRFTPCLNGHIKENADFYKYILSHSRKGTFFSPIAFISGRYDGWLNFGGGKVGGLPKVVNGEAENTWNECIKLFYPMSKPSDCLIFKHVENDQKPLGYFSGNPLGNIDAVPVTAPSENFEKYKLLSFAGYHCAEKEDFEKFENLCQNGLHLVLSRAHFASQTDIAKVKSYDLNEIDTVLSFTDGKCVYENKTYKGQTIPVCTNLKGGYELLESCDDGTPLLVKYPVGKGFVTLLNANLYPSNKAVCSLYMSYIEKCAKEICEDQKIYAKVGNNVQFSVYDSEDERHIYLLAIDWYNKSDEPRNAILLENGNEYSVKIPFGTMIKAVAKDNVIIYPTSENGEVVEISGGFATVQGYGKVEFIICKDGKQTSTKVDFEKDATGKIKI